LLLAVSKQKNHYFLRRWDLQKNKQIGSAEPIHFGNGVAVLGFAFDGQLCISYEGVNQQTQFPTIQLSLLNAALQETRLYTLPGANGVTSFRDAKYAFSKDGSKVAIVTSSHIYAGSTSGNRDLNDLEQLSSPREWLSIALSQDG